MKIKLGMLIALLSLFLLAACASSQGTNKSMVQTPASQEVVRGEARNRAKAHADLGFEYYAQRQLGVALQEARLALDNDSAYTPAYNLLALVYMGLGDTKSAEESFQRALQTSPGDPEIANNYGWFLCQNKRESQSFQYFGIALQNPLYPTPQRALNNAAKCAMQIQDYKGAETYLTRALTLNPDDVRALQAMSSLRYQQKRYGEARSYIVEAHKNVEPSAESSWLAYQIARRLGNRDDEARYMSLLRKKFPDSEEYKKLMQGATE